MEMSRTFNFDDFDEQVREALDRNDEEMAQVYALSGLKRVIEPTQFGGMRPDELPPDDAA